MRPPATRPRVAMGSVAMWPAVLIPPATRPARPCTARKTLKFLSGFFKETLSERPSNTQEAHREGRASKARAPTRLVISVAELFPGFQRPTFQNKNVRRPLPSRRAFSLPAHSSTHGAKEKSPTGTT